VEIGPGESRHFDAAHFQTIPAQLLSGLDLRIEADARFIAYACKNHNLAGLPHK
jgi:hypothetical protein